MSSLLKMKNKAVQAFQCVRGLGIAAAALVLASCTSISGPGASIGGGVIAGAATAEGLKQGGVDNGTANLVGLGVGLLTTQVISNAGQQSNPGRCQKVLVQNVDSYGNRYWQEQTRCTQTTQGYPAPR
jgi:hypothetical protein